MRKLKMATILLYGKNKFSYIHPQMSSDGLNLPPPPRCLINLMLTPFFTEGVIHI